MAQLTEGEGDEEESGGCSRVGEIVKERHGAEE